MPRDSEWLQDSVRRRCRASTGELRGAGRKMLSGLARNRENRKRLKRGMLDIAHGRVGTTRGVEATALASEFRDQFRARTGREV